MRPRSPGSKPSSTENFPVQVWALLLLVDFAQTGKHGKSSQCIGELIGSYAARRFRPRAEWKAQLPRERARIRRSACRCSRIHVDGSHECAEPRRLSRSDDLGASRRNPLAAPNVRRSGAGPKQRVSVSFGASVRHGSACQSIDSTDFKGSGDEAEQREIRSTGTLARDR